MIGEPTIDPTLVDEEAGLVEVPDHQVLLTFGSELEADQWVAWWYADGRDLFMWGQEEDE